MKKAEQPIQPVKGFPIKYIWNEEWVPLFDEQIKLLRRDITRNIVNDHFVMYLSCPISPRGGGDTSTNVAIANYTARKLYMDWGRRVYVLNPAAYQMESKEGRGLLKQHAETLGIDLEDHIKKNGDPSGGDYMRMWTKVLVEDDDALVDRKRNGATPRRGLNCGGFFSAYYFIGPSDVRAFFMQGGATNIVKAIEDYFSAQYNIDEDFKSRYDQSVSKKGMSWEGIRDAFVLYYSLRAGAGFSKGAHDEWNIWSLLNEKRRTNTDAYDLGEEIAGFWDGIHVDASSKNIQGPNGYAK